jgi:membrane protein DedA with SNARE-associated domain
MSDFWIKNIEVAAAYAQVWGFVIIFVLMAIESSFIPLPSEVVMIPAGFLAYRCELTFASPHLDALVAILAGTTGSLVGAFFNYYLSMFLGRPILYKYGKYFFVRPAFLERSEEIFREYGGISTFVCRLLPALRHLISIPAGLSRMDVTKFSIFTLAGAAIWATVLTSIGYYIGRISNNMTYPEIYYKGVAILRDNYIWIFVSLAMIIVVYAWVHVKVMKGRIHHEGAKKAN